MKLIKLVFFKIIVTVGATTYIINLFTNKFHKGNS